VTALAFVLVLASAGLHALWNFMVKRSGASGAVFIWLFTLPSVILMAPVAIWMIITRQVTFTVAAALFLAGSAVIHTVYFLLLARGYRDGDLSVVYPIARGTGPLLAGIIAIVTLHERPSLAAMLGALCITAGAMLLAYEQRIGARAPGVSRVRSAEYGLAIGVLIGIYTVWDKHLVSNLSVHPVILEWIVSGSIGLLVTPAALANLPLVRSTWQKHKGVAVAGAILSSASYILFLTALATAPVSRAAPLRETSILIGALLGTRLLGEGRTRQRLAAAGAISAGVMLVSLG
jgi:drug/metabolite transporter (DMT)-like permease